MNNALQHSSPASQAVGRNQPSTPLQWLAPLLAGDSTSQEVALAILDKQRGLTPAKAQEAPQVSALTRTEEGAIATSQALTNALLFTAAQFNVVRNMSDLQMAFLAEGLLELYWDWRFDEFLYVLREGVRQNWGKTYDRLDPPTMYEWCKAYLDARTIQIENDAFQAHQARKKFEKQPTKSELWQHPEFGSDYPDARAQLELLTDADLLATCQAYRAGQGTDQQFIADVAQEVINERRAAHYLARIGQAILGDEKQYATYAVEIESERRQREKAENRALRLAAAAGNNAAAGLPASPVPGLYDNLPDAPAFGFPSPSTP